MALDGVDLELGPGELRGLLGPNGAGKTTLLRTLFGLIPIDAGSIEIFGERLGPHRAVPLNGIAGFVEEPAFYGYLSGRANLELLAEIDDAPTPDVDEILERVGLGDRDGDRVSGYSTGMRQRLGIAAALLRRPRLLLLDEPTSGLDRPAPARSARFCASSPPTREPVLLADQRGARRTGGEDRAARRARRRGGAREPREPVGLVGPVSP